MKKNKVVINTCYGGFGLSDAALDFLSERGCSVVKSRWGGYLVDEPPPAPPAVD